jgi:nicotinamidase-related amidase
VSPPNPAEGALLLCLDLQPVFLRAVDDGAALLKRCQFAVAAAVRLGLPVAFTEQVPDKLGATESSLLALVEAPQVHAKDAFSALAPASLAHDALVNGRPFEHLILCGVETPICVYQTAVDALREGLAVTILADCVGARRPQDARLSLEALARAGAHVLASETVYYSLLGGATHPAFRAYTDLVKKYA